MKLQKRDYKMKLNQIGMSLVEAMVGLAIASGIGLVLMRQQDTATKIQTKANINQEVNSVSSVVQTALANRAVCTLSLKGKGKNDFVPALVDGKINPLFPATGQAEYVVDTLNNHVFENQEVNGIKVVSLQIVEQTNPVTLVKKDFLKVLFDVDPKKIKKKIGGQTVAKLYLLQGTKDGAGKYLYCHSEQTNILNSAIQTACTSMGATWSTATTPPKCLLTNLPNCIISNEACRGVFAINRGVWNMKIYSFNGRTCTMHYQKDSFVCSRSFDRTCGCSTPGCTCNTNFGHVSCFRRQDRGCADNPLAESMTAVNRCCQI
jgi:hypothetical protein